MTSDGDAGKTHVRSTVDLPREINRSLKRFALDHDTTIQAMLGALAEAVVDQDPPVMHALKKRLPNLER